MFGKHHRCFFPLQPVLNAFKGFSDWPSINDYNDFLKQSSNEITSLSGATISFVLQTERSNIFENGYEPRIYLTGEVQTRKNNWHDFFNMCVWQTFPRIKVQINCLQYRELSKKKGNRSSLENYMTHFDESGVIVLCSNPKLVGLWKCHRWQELFWRQRDAVNNQMQFFLFGHALYEKALQPYIGFTGKAIILPVEQTILSDTLKTQINFIDQQVSQKFSQADFTANPQQLLPLPILGVPGFWSENEDAQFYQNQDYFRVK